MYSIRDLKKGLKQPNKAIREINRLFHTRFNRWDHNKKGVDIMKEEWDFFIILDACRYDMFEEISSIEGNLKKKVSKGASTIEFLRGNFRNKEMHDTVYLTANPQFKWHEEQLQTEFFEVIDLWEDEDYWDDENSTVPPEKVTEKAREIVEEYPEKKVIIHYMQPHFPFLTYKDEEITNVPLEEMFWNQMMKGELDITKEKVWKMYNNNLERALDSVEELIPALNGKTVITSDHGNFVGEKSSPIPVKEWGHPLGIFHPTLVDVPWLEIESGERRSVVSEEPESHNEGDVDVDEEDVKEKLSALGYN